MYRDGELDLDVSRNEASELMSSSFLSYISTPSVVFDTGVRGRRGRGERERSGRSRAVDEKDGVET